jgi:hypothetical protein
VRVGELDLSNLPPPSTVLISHPRDFPADRQCLGGGGEDWGQGDGLPRPHATSWKGDRQSWRGKGEGGGDEGWWEGGTMCYMDLEKLLHRL